MLDYSDPAYDLIIYEPGMDWGTWVQSSYNTYGLIDDNGNILLPDWAAYMIDNGVGDPVITTDLIKEYTDPDSDTYSFI